MCNKLCLIMVLSLTMSFTTSAVQAETRHDLQSCKEALTSKGLYATSDHQVKFHYAKGNTRKRTVYLRLKDKRENKKFDVACALNKRKVVDLQVTPRS